MSKYKSRISNGLCGKCGKPSETSRCAECMERDRQVQKAHRAVKIEQGLCYQCSRPAASGYTHCEKCRFASAKRKYVRQYGGWQELFDKFERQKGRCAISNVPITIGVDADLDHIIPRSKGGSDDISNLQWTHRKINRMKTDLEFSEFVRLCQLVCDNNQSPSVGS